VLSLPLFPDLDRLVLNAFVTDKCRTRDVSVRLYAVGAAIVDKICANAV
jgi:hypothetical protein